MEPRRLSALLALALGISMLVGGPVRAELDEADWKKVKKQAGRLMKKPGERATKFGVIEALGRDDSRRATEILVKWALCSLKLQQGPLAKELEETREDYERVERLLLKKYKRMPPTRADDKNEWLRLKRPFDAAKKNDEVENAVRYALGEAFRVLTDAAGVKYLIEEGLPTVQKAKFSEEAQLGIVRGLLMQPKERILATALALAGDAERAKLRIRAINWIGQHQVREGFDALVGALQAKEVAVRRASVFALQAVDDNRAVKALIDSMQRMVDPQLNAEIDDALHYFTGKSFEGSAAVWKRWWSNEGAAWLARKETERFEPRREALPGGTKVRFYGIPTESHHVVFVLDRSGSMKNPAGDKAKEEKKKKKPKPKGPVTGPGRERDKEKKGGGSEEPVAGDTKMEVAKNQLARSLDEIAKGVNFNVVFYSKDVKVWKEPPELQPSSSANKKAAKKWFMGLEAEGPTLMFEALKKALEYADTVGEDKKKPRTGADTIFLLSDGSPTGLDGKPLPADQLEAQYKEFIEANKLYHCVVHTIGIGPGHNSSVLRRLARDTGGQYKAVGTN